VSTKTYDNYPFEPSQGGITIWRSMFSDGSGTLTAYEMRIYVQVTVGIAGVVSIFGLVCDVSGFIYLFIEHGIVHEGMDAMDE